MGAKSSTQMVRFSPDLCQLLSRCSFTFLNVNCFTPNCSKIAAECDWNRKISQNAQNLGVFRKNRCFFFEKLDKFFKNSNILTNCKGGKFAVECVCKGMISLNVFSALIMRFFQQKNQKFFNVGKNKKNIMECLFEKKLLNLFKNHLYKKGRRKISRFWPAALFHLFLKSESKAEKQPFRTYVLLNKSCDEIVY